VPENQHVIKKEKIVLLHTKTNRILMQKQDIRKHFFNYFFRKNNRFNLFNAFFPKFVHNRQSEKFTWGRPGFDRGHEVAWCMSRSSHLVNPLENK